MVQSAPPSTRVALVVAQQSDPGLDPEKQVNEDACAAKDLELGHLLVVCDGMGGHVGGKDASEAAVRTIFSDLEAVPPGTNPGAALKAAIEHAGQAVFELGGNGANFLRPGSTVVAILSHAGGSEVAHVGDSRAYLMRDAQIYPLTRDHSMVQQMIDAGVLKPEEAVGHPDANKITRALGMTVTVDVELRPTPLAHQKGDIFLLASDGLCDLVSPAEMLNVTMQARQARGLDFACQQLVSLANTRGGHDNITVLLAEVASCPTCAQSKTVIPQDAPELPDVPDDGPKTLPVLPPLAASAAPTTTAQVQPTMVDDGPEPLIHPAPGPGTPEVGLPGAERNVGNATYPAPTWIGEDGQNETAAFEAVKRRRLLWLLAGLILVLLGMLLIVSSIGWAFAMSAATRPCGARHVALGEAVGGGDSMQASSLVGTSRTLASWAVVSTGRHLGEGQRTTS